MYPPHHLGGYELMWHSNVSYLRSQGHDVRVLTTDYLTPAPDRGVPEGPEVHRELRWYWRDHAWPRLSLRERWRLERHNLRVLERHLDELRPSVIAWWAMGGMSMSLIEACRRRGIPAIGIVHDDWLLYGPKEDQWQSATCHLGPLRTVVEIVSRVPSRLEFDDALSWLLVSRVILSRAQAGGWRLRRHGIAHSGIDTALFRPHPAQPWGGRLLCVGRLDPRKGIHTAIEAMSELPDMKLTVVGSGDDAYVETLINMTERTGTASRVSFERRDRRRLPETYAAADAVLFPVNWDEPFGLVPLEAMAVGRPVVASGTGGSGEYLRDGENCLLYGPPEDASALANAVNRLATDAALRDRLREGGEVTAPRLSETSFNRQVEAAMEKVDA